MNAREANVLLAKAALNDPRMKRVDPVERADMAEEWAEVLHDVTLTDAVAAMREHYASSRDAIMPADIRKLAGAVDGAALPDITDQIVEASKQRMLAAAGVTEAEYLDHTDDEPWLRAHFPTEFEQRELLSRYPNEEIPDE